MKHVICKPRIQKSCLAQYLTDGIFLNLCGELQYMSGDAKQAIYTRVFKSESAINVTEAFNTTRPIFKVFLQNFTKYSISIFTVYWFVIQENYKVTISVFAKSEDDDVNNFFKFLNIIA